MGTLYLANFNLEDKMSLVGDMLIEPWMRSIQWEFDEGSPEKNFRPDIPSESVTWIWGITECEWWGNSQELWEESGRVEEDLS